MSKHFHLRCVTHEPYIASDEVGNWGSALPEIRMAIRTRDKLVANMAVLVENGDAYDLWSDQPYKRVLRWFLWRHPHCDLEIWDEYGQQYSMEDTVEEKPIARDTVLGTVQVVEDVEGGVRVFFKSLTPEGDRVLRRFQNG